MRTRIKYPSWNFHAIENCNMNLNFPFTQTNSPTPFPSIPLACTRQSKSIFNWSRLARLLSLQNFLKRVSVKRRVKQTLKLEHPFGRALAFRSPPRLRKRNYCLGYCRDDATWDAARLNSAGCRRQTLSFSIAGKFQGCCLTY